VTDLDAPKEAGTKVECAEEKAEELEKAQFRWGNIQFLLNEAAWKNGQFFMT
jgi:hypothetical protein